jgi:hypothetical protein
MPLASGAAAAGGGGAFDGSAFSCGSGVPFLAKTRK